MAVVEAAVQEVERTSLAASPESPPLPIVRTGPAYRRVADAARAQGRTVGVVPTMGALHAGHSSLIERAAHECDVVIVTIFVNPTQFGEATDLANYPRTFEADLDAAAVAGATVVFAPPVAEMYPDGLQTLPVPSGVATVARPLEGVSRPGHFDGVATVVPRLLAPAGPCRAYFGEKDFQQLALVRCLLAEIGLPVDVVGCDTVRDADGLALSSRNVRLSPDERHAALALARALRAGAEVVTAGGHDRGEVEAAMATTLGVEPVVEVDYAACVRADTLEPVDRLEGTVPLRLLVAARVGPVRLIDNIDPRRPLPAALARPEPVR
jgi:pantoate--beta-alanine ligase